MDLSKARRFGALSVAAVLIAWGALTDASASTLDRIKQDKAIRIAYREDAPPFSYKDKIGEPTGFMVDLCREVAKKLADQLQLGSLNVVYVPVTAADRFEAIQQQKADLLCEPTSATLSRREIVDFSIPTFVDGASLMIRADGPHDLKAMAGKKIGVLGGTTTEQSLRIRSRRRASPATSSPPKPTPRASRCSMTARSRPISRTGLFWYP